MKLRLLLPLLALPAAAHAAGNAATPESISQLRRDFVTVQQQRDTLAGQVTQLQSEQDKLQAERDSLKAERDSLATERDQIKTERDKLQAEHAAQPSVPPDEAQPTASPDPTDAERAKKEAEMTVDMTVRAYALKEQEAIEATKTAEAAVAKQLAAEQERDAALAEAKQSRDERDAAKQNEAAAIATRAAMQNELFAAQIRIENLSRALGIRSGLPAQTASAHIPPTSVAEAPSTPQPPPPPTPTPAPATVRTHKVAEGETLSLISFKYYQSPNKWDKIMAANPTKLKNPDQLRPGMILVIP
jgi:nucleoid-associated protein YgaU